MSHDTYAAWAATEVAREYAADSSKFHTGGITHTAVMAGREARNDWPHADGVLEISGSLSGATVNYRLALEFKRHNEGLHGVLTALGQAHAYLTKGPYHGSVIVVPNSYLTRAGAASYVADVLNKTNAVVPIAVFGYEDPDPTKTSPFSGKLTSWRALDVNSSTYATTVKTAASQGIMTQWAHVREGSDTPDGFYRFLRLARDIDLQQTESPPKLPTQMLSAIARIDSSAEPYAYITSTVAASTSLQDRTWRAFWISYIFHSDMWIPWTKSGTTFSVNHVPTRLVQWINSKPMEMFSGKANSIKNKLVDDLSSGVITENEAWERFVINVRNRAHSFREDIDSTLGHIGLLDADGRPSRVGLNWLAACDRWGFDSEPAKRALKSIILRDGGYDVLLHYIHRLTSDRMRSDPLAFTDPANPRIFLKDDYVSWLLAEMSLNLKVLKVGTPRSGSSGGVARRPFQAELSLLRKLNLIPESRAKRFRVGVGLDINWPAVQDALSNDDI